MSHFVAIFFMLLQSPKENQTNLGCSIEIITKVFALKHYEYVDYNTISFSVKDINARGVSLFITLTMFYFIGRAKLT